jgi:hypothetical protein
MGEACPRGFQLRTGYKKELRNRSRMTTLPSSSRVGVWSPRIKTRLELRRRISHYEHNGTTQLHILPTFTAKPRYLWIRGIRYPNYLEF